MKLKSISKLYMGLIFFFLYSPLVVLIAFSFNESKSRNVWTGFSLKWYANLFADKEILRALFNTIVVAVIASVLATIIGTIACFGILKMKKWTKKFIMNVNNLPIVNPEIVTPRHEELSGQQSASDLPGAAGKFRGGLRL